MDRRDTLRTLILGGLAGSGLLSSCVAEPATAIDAESTQPSFPNYGRTVEELRHDAEMLRKPDLTEHEMATLTILCDIILPADDRSGSAGDAGVPGFIAFIIKDMPVLETPVRGGLSWLNAESSRRSGKSFVDATPEERIALVETIAYPPSPLDPLPEVLETPMHGTRFFDLMRFLTLTGFYTSEMGVKDDLGYKGNVPNEWDGVPAEVLAEHDVELDAEWLAKCLKLDTRSEVAQWDDEGNLVG